MNEEITDSIIEAIMPTVTNSLRHSLSKIINDDEIDVKLYRNENGKLGAEVVFKTMEESVIILSPMIEHSASDVIPSLEPRNTMEPH